MKRLLAWVGRAAATLVAVVMVSLAVAGCDSRERWILESPTFYPTALDYWPEEKAFLVGSYHDGSIQRIAFNGDPASDPFQEKLADGRTKALRLKVDGGRNRLWILDVDGVCVYTLPEKILLRRFELPRSVPSVEDCLPDMAVDPATGAVYISDVRQPTIYRISDNAIEDTLQRTDIPVRFERGKEHRGGFSALLVNDNPFTLIAGSASSGGLWKVDPTTGQATAIPVPSLKGICGMSANTPREKPFLYYPAQRPPIYLTTGFYNQVMRILVTPDLKRGEVARIAARTLVQTPVSLAAFSNYIVVASSQLSHHEDFNGDQNPLVPFRLVLMRSAFETVRRVDR